MVKIESRGGDPTRHTFAGMPRISWATRSSSWRIRGKRGVVLDTSKPAGREALIRILADAVGFITNLRPGARTRAGLD